MWPDGQNMMESIVLTIGQIGLIGLAALAVSLLASTLVIRVFSIRGFIKQILKFILFIIVGCCSVYWVIWKIGG